MPREPYLVVRGIRERSWFLGFRNFTGFWDSEILLVSVWSRIHTVLRPQNFDDFESKERNSFLISCTIATMGIFVISIQLQDNLQIYWYSHQCGWIITFALSKGIYRFSGDQYLQHVSNWVATSDITTAYATTRTDSVFGKVLLYSRNGWPVTFPELLKPYWKWQLEISIEDDCFMRGICVIVPHKLRKAALQELHQSHSEVVHTKAVAQSYMWWPGLDQEIQEIQELVRSSVHCQAVKNAQPVAQLHPWLRPPEPWQRLHIDFAGPWTYLPYCRRCTLQVA